MTESPAPILFRDRPFAAGAALLVVCALVGISHQSRRFAQSQAMRAAVQEPLAAAPGIADVPSSTPLGLPNPPGEPPPPTPALLRQVGPFTVGQTLIPGWSVDAFEITGEGFIAVLAGKPGRARFEVTCSPSELRSPFDLGAAHIFYANNLAFSELEAVGWAFRAHIHDAAEGKDICDRLADWRTSARRTMQPR